MRRLLPHLWFTALLLLLAQPALAASDARMQVLVAPDAERGITLDTLRSNIAQAADMALPRLWARIVPQQAQRDIPGNIKGIRFLQRATPGDDGVTIVFQSRRVFAWLKANNIPYIAEAPAWHLTIDLQNAAGRSMPESAARLRRHAENLAEYIGYSEDSTAPALVLAWRWLDSRQVSLSVRGGTRLGEFAQTRIVASGDPAQQLQPWLDELLLKARDAYVASAEPILPVVTGPQVAPADQPLEAVSASADGYLLLKVQRQAPLSEQILFEQDLLQDPRILDLSLRQVNRDGQQYRLHLKGSDDLWLRDWFSRRGMVLTPTIEGWVASQEMPAR
ncbi:MAG: hypothetical protein COW18_13920 [Zetaproteobacteria bacterium CG12_big_fil_rev_8_21_14_0_65_54_13]|nr:MAG: hypothetical protein COW18_13920 [Zetaproteobacteria bacterium CG12_big_fil_rev_8_21_14_0_65_54_13]PIX54501.1 MAG: hypothetical protein COZ50_07595 [Zetaproteobacteria bacterium CG_4_10_14_3_um_filter_54_28]PJA28674.1 MAG: hypothetical protein CO188_08625 [Zetaproteobacteria bacterium CG_4_9_14_3_um_filter_54_145]